MKQSPGGSGSQSRRRLWQFYRRGRGGRLEIDALVTAVQELGRLVEVATPTIDAVLALVRGRGRQAGLYGNDAQR